MVDMQKRIEKVLTGANQRKIAEQMGVSAQAVGKWKKTGHIDRSNAVKLAQLQGYSAEWLLTGTGSPRQGPVSGLNVDILADLLEQMRGHGLSVRQKAQIIAANYPTAVQGERPNLEPSIRLVVNN